MPDQPIHHCDFGHETKAEVRRLPHNGNSDAADFVCHVHFLQEMMYRRNFYPNLPRPTWESLDVYQEVQL